MAERFPKMNWQEIVEFLDNTAPKYLVGQYNNTITFALVVYKLIYD